MLEFFLAMTLCLRTCTYETPMATQRGSHGGAHMYASICLWNIGREQHGPSLRKCIIKKLSQSVFVVKVALINLKHGLGVGNVLF